MTLKKLICIVFFISVLSSLCFGSPIASGGGHSGGGSFAKIESMYPSSYNPKSLVAEASKNLYEFVESYRQARQLDLESDSQLVRGQLLRAIRNGYETPLYKTGRPETVGEVVDLFIGIMDTMISDPDFESTLKGLSFEFLDGPCLDDRNDPNDFCTPYYDKAAPIQVNQSFLKLVRPPSEAVQGLLGHELTRKFLGQVDDDHLFASAMMDVAGVFNKGFFTQGTCTVAVPTCLEWGKESAPNYPVPALSLITDPLWAITSPFAERICVRYETQVTRWEFLIDDELPAPGYGDFSTVEFGEEPSNGYQPFFLQRSSGNYIKLYSMSRPGEVPDTDEFKPEYDKYVERWKLTISQKGEFKDIEIRCGALPSQTLPVTQITNSIAR